MKVEINEANYRFKQYRKSDRFRKASAKAT